MIRPRTTRCLALFLAALTLGAAPHPRSAPRPSETDVEAHARVHLRTYRVRVVSDRAAEPGHCRDVRAEHLDVRLRGKRLAPDDVIAMDRASHTNLHALLLDASGSMGDSADVLRHAAKRYVDRLRPGEHAMIITFDAGVTLARAPTVDRDTLRRAIDDLVLSPGTSLYDALYLTLRESDAHDRRPVIVLVTDGRDTSSIHPPREILDLVQARPEVTVFVIGTWDARYGTNGREDLVRLAARSNGELFLDPGPRLDRTFQRIRDVLDNEALLTINDRDADAVDASIDVRAEDRRCDVTVLSSDSPRRSPATPLPTSDNAARLPFPPAPLLRDLHDGGAIWADPRCGTGTVTLDRLWSLEATADGLHGCTVDIIREAGLLYSAARGVYRAEEAVHKTRRLDVSAPPVDEVESHPVEAMNFMAETALSMTDSGRDDADRSAEPRHGRPYDEYPFLMNGATFLDARSAIAMGLATIDGYRDRLLEQVRHRSSAAFEEFRSRLGELRPGLDRALLDEIARSSETGREILARGDTPTETDLRGLLAAWLGDISAHELFSTWERRALDSRIARGRAFDRRAFLERWRVLRPVFALPTPARVVALLLPPSDPAGDRIGFWRIVLPRPGWMLDRRAGHARPLDLIPDQPFAYVVIDDVLRRSPSLADHLRRHAFRAVAVQYELPGDENDDPRLCSTVIRAGPTTSFVEPRCASSSPATRLDPARRCTSRPRCVSKRPENAPAS